MDISEVINHNLKQIKNHQNIYIFPALNNTQDHIMDVGVETSVSGSSFKLMYGLSQWAIIRLNDVEAKS